MSDEILRHLLQEEQKRSLEYKIIAELMTNAAKNICDKYVHPRFLNDAMGEIDKVYQKQKTEYRRKSCPHYLRL